MLFFYVNYLRSDAFAQSLIVYNIFIESQNRNKKFEIIHVFSVDPTLLHNTQ